MGKKLKLLKKFLFLLLLLINQKMKRIRLKITKLKVATTPTVTVKRLKVATRPKVTVKRLTVATRAKVTAEGLKVATRPKVKVKRLKVAIRPKVMAERLKVVTRPKVTVKMLKEATRMMLLDQLILKDRSNQRAVKNLQQNTTEDPSRCLSRKPNNIARRNENPYQDLKIARKMLKWRSLAQLGWMFLSIKFSITTAFTTISRDVKELIYKKMAAGQF